MQDANFDVLGAIDDGGDLVERYEYTPYGERTIFFSPGSNDPLLYSATGASRRVSIGGTDQPYGLLEIGHQSLHHDEEVGLVYNRARMLHVELGRFVQRDPLDYIDGGNVYTYYAGLHMATDPFGYSMGRGFPRSCQELLDNLCKSVDGDPLGKASDKINNALDRLKKSIEHRNKWGRKHQKDGRNHSLKKWKGYNQDIQNQCSGLKNFMDMIQQCIGPFSSDVQDAIDAAASSLGNRCNPATQPAYQPMPGPLDHLKENYAKEWREDELARRLRDAGALGIIVFGPGKILKLVPGGGRTVPLPAAG